MNLEKMVTEICDDLAKLWRIELGNDDEMKQVYREVRGKASRLRQVESDLAKYEAYMSKHAKATEQDSKKPQAPRGLRPHRKAKR